jgi:hypothetical protein
MATLIGLRTDVQVQRVPERYQNFTRELKLSDQPQSMVVDPSTCLMALQK